MSTDHEDLHRNPRDMQIRILEEKDSSLKPHIQKAYELIVIGDKIEEKDNVEILVERIFKLAEELAKNKGSKNGDFIYTLYNLPEGLIVSNEILKRILPPIKRLRKELFSKETSPFPNSPNTALTWLKNESKRESSPFLNNVKNNKKRTYELRHEILRKIHELNEFTHENYKLSNSSRCLPYQVKDDWREFVSVWDGTSLARLEEETRKLSEITNFSQAQLVKFVLTSIKPLTPIYNLKVEYPKKIVTLQIYRPLNKGKIVSLYNTIKEIFERKGKQFLDQKHRELYFLVERHNGLPKRKKKKFWEKIQKEWNKSHKKNKYGDPNSITVTYKRILKAIQSGISPIKPLDEQFSLDKPKGKFETKEEWEKHKEELKKMARFHAKVLRQIKEGKRKTEKVVDLNIK